MERKEKQSLGEEINSHVTDHLMAGIEEVAGQRGEHYIRVSHQTFMLHTGMELRYNNVSGIVRICIHKIKQIETTVLVCCQCTSGSQGVEWNHRNPASRNCRHGDGAG